MRKPLSMPGGRYLPAAALCLLATACQPAGPEGERLRQALDRLEIAEILNRHQIYVDAGDPEAWSGLYAADGSYESPFGRSHGREELTRMSSDLQEAGFTQGKRHLTGPAMIDVRGDRALALSYYWVAETGAFPPVIVSTGRYCDEFRRERGRWRIARRVQSIDPNWLLRETAVPGGVATGALEAHGNRACPARPARWSEPPDLEERVSRIPRAPASF